MTETKKFSETQGILYDKEEDRYPLKPGDKFTITGYIVQPSQKYPAGIIKINGLSLTDGTIVKYRTTGKAILNQLQNMAKDVGCDSGHFINANVGVQVFERKSGGGLTYLTFGDIE